MTRCAAGCRSAAAALLVTLATCCAAGDPEPPATPGTSPTSAISRADFIEAMVARDHVDPAQAACTWAAVVDEYDRATLAEIASSGLHHLDISQWGPYTYAVVECVLGDELVEPSRSGDGVGGSGSEVPAG